MRRIALLGIVGLLGLSAAAWAAPAKPAGAWASGRIERFDAGTNTLVVAQGKHDMTFTLAPDAHILQGSKAMSASDLGNDVGRTVRVQYTMAGGARTARRIQVREKALTSAKGSHKAAPRQASVVAH